MISWNVSKLLAYIFIEEHLTQYSKSLLENQEMPGVKDRNLKRF